MRVLCIIVFVVAALVGATAAAKVFGALDQLPLERQPKLKELQPAFVLIDKYLESIESTDSETLIKQIKSVYARKQRNPLQKLKPEAIRLMRAMRLFARLTNSLRSCGLESYQTLAENHLAMGGARSASTSSPKKSWLVLRDCARRHALLCGPVYERNYIDLYHRASGDVAASLRAVESLFGLSVTGPKDQNEDEDEDEAHCIRNPLGFSSPSEAKLSKRCLDQIVQRLLSASNENGSEMTLDKLISITKGYNRMIEMRMVKPCRVYREHFRPIFAPAIYDLATTIIEDSELAKELLVRPQRGQQQSFGEGLRLYRACEFVLRDVQNISNQLLGQISDLYQPESFEKSRAGLLANRLAT